MKFYIILLSLTLTGCGNNNIALLNKEITTCEKRTRERCSWVIMPDSSAPQIAEIYKQYNISVEIGKEQTQSINISDFATGAVIGIGTLIK